MARFLDTLEPLTDLVLSTADPTAACDALLIAADASNSDALLQALPDSGLGSPALRYAGILTPEGTIAVAARDQLLRLQTMVAIRLREADRWTPIMTVPPYLRSALPWGVVVETLPALYDLVSTASRRLVVASPFLDAGFDNLIPALTRFCLAGGQLLLITRELVRTDSPNAAAVRLLREGCGARSGLEVVSWEDEGLGLHMKAVVADSRRAYVGSANLTWGGMGHQAELGVSLEGPAVREIERLLEILASQLKSRRRPSGR